MLRTDYTDFGGTFLFIYNLFTDPENNETHRTNSIALGSPWEYPTALISKCEVTASLFKVCEVLKKILVIVLNLCLSNFKCALGRAG